METAIPLYTIEFDFTSPAQQAVLTNLQERGCSLLVFRGIGSLDSVQQTPIWLSISFNDIFGVFTFTYAPQYKAYVTHPDMLGVETGGEAGVEAGKSFAMSDVVPLDTVVIFQQNGSFTISNRAAPAGTIALKNAATAGKQALTAGLAASTGGTYRPFSTYPFNPTTTVVMMPANNLVIGVAQLDIASGVVTIDSFAPGAQLKIVPHLFTYTLSIEGDQFEVVGTGSTTVTAVEGDTMSKLASGS